MIHISRSIKYNLEAELILIIAAKKLEGKKCIGCSGSNFKLSIVGKVSTTIKQLKPAFLGSESKSADFELLCKDCGIYSNYLVQIKD